jgi:hypothetical protein
MQARAQPELRGLRQRVAWASGRKLVLWGHFKPKLESILEEAKKLPRALEWRIYIKYAISTRYNTNTTL